MKATTKALAVSQLARARPFPITRHPVAVIASAPAANSARVASSVTAPCVPPDGGARKIQSFAMSIRPSSVCLADRFQGDRATARLPVSKRVRSSQSARGSAASIAQTASRRTRSNGGTPCRNSSSGATARPRAIPM